MSKTARIELENIKCSDGWTGLANDLGYSNEDARDIFEYGEYGHITIEVDENLNIIGGKIHPFKK